MSDFQKEDLSLEETNKLRIQLGLKPLTEDKPVNGGGTSHTSIQNGSSSSFDQDELAARNFAEKQEKERKQSQDQQLKEKLEKAQTKRQLARQLKGPTLGDPEPLGAGSSSSKADTLKWLKKAQKRAKEHAVNRAKEFEAQEAQAQAEYGQDDLLGLRVLHDLDDFKEGEERILTLRDSKVLDDQDDELMDVELEQTEKERLDFERKKGPKEYTGLDDDEFDSNNLTGKRREVLSKYDADIDDVGLIKGDDAGFRLGGGILKADKEEANRKQQEQAALASNKELLSLDYAKNQHVSDYLQEGEVGFKKSKTKKRKKVAKVKIDYDDDNDDEKQDSSAPGSMSAVNRDVEMESAEPQIQVRKPRAIETENFIDDDELQASLAKTRRQKAKRTFSKMTPEMIAANLAAQKAAEEAERTTSGSPIPEANGMSKTDGTIKAEDESDGLTFDPTAEFVRTLSHRPTEDRDSTRPLTVKSESKSIKDEATQSTLLRVKQEPVDETMEPITSYDYIVVKKEDDDDESEDEGLVSPVVKKGSEAGKDAVAESEPEPVASKGLASTLALLRNQGMLPTVSADTLEREGKQKQYDKWLSERRQEEMVREQERQASKAQGSSKDQATREYENRKRELDEARSAQDKFKNYQPDVEIKYHDEFGRELSSRDAWKRLSHVFHGKKPGAKKTEKRLKKIEEERKRERMSAGDTPTGMIQAFQSRAERSGQAHMVLSVGNRGSAPQEAELLGPNLIPLEKGSKGKGKDGTGSLANNKANGGGGRTMDGGIATGSGSVTSTWTSVVGAQNGQQSVTTTRAGWSAIGLASTTSSPVPAGFAPLSSSATESSAGSLSGVPTASVTPTLQSFRLAFSTASKRKAEDETE